jgi:transcriptional regulator with XRE-family HTH domain
MPTPPEPFAVQVKALAEKRGLSISKLGWMAHDPKVEGTSQDTLNKVLQGKRPLNDALARAVANALEIEPESFAEYRLSVLRSALDEREVGFENAAALLAAIEAGLSVPTAQDFARVIGAVLEQSETPSTSTPATKHNRRHRGSKG